MADHRDSKDRLRAVARRLSDRVEPREAGELRHEVKSALARWVVRRQRQPGFATPQSHDEATHAWDGRRRFAEEYSFAATQDDLGLVLRLEWLPGREAHRVWVILLDDGGVTSLPGGQKIVRRRGQDLWCAGDLQLDCIEPLKRWHVRHVGQLAHYASGSLERPGAMRRVSIDVEFVASQPAFTPGADDDPELLARRLAEATWDRVILRQVRRAQMRGYAQVGCLRGTVVVGERTVRLEADCVRQHNWGVRDWGASDYALQGFMVPRDGTQTWVHHAGFPFVVLEGGFRVAEVAGEDAIVPLRTIRADERSDVVALDLDDRLGMQSFRARRRSEAVFTVDGRGQMRLGWVEILGGGTGIVAEQRRALRRV